MAVPDVLVVGLDKQIRHLGGLGNLRTTPVHGDHGIYVNRGMAINGHHGTAIN